MDLNIVTNLIRYDLARLKQSIVNFKNNPNNLHFIPKEENVKKKNTKTTRRINYFFICMHFILYYIYYLFLLNKPSKSIRQENFSYNTFIQIIFIH
ncbi:hypothetical protein GHY87_02735 [Campylobacter coli]|nr:hypothetical protein [Campylobacter coli]